MGPVQSRAGPRQGGLQPHMWGPVQPFPATALTSLSRSLADPVCGLWFCSARKIPQCTVPGPRRGLPPHRHKGPDPSPHSPCGPCGSLDLSWPAYCMGLQPLQTCNSGTLPSRMWGGEGSPARHPTKSGEKAQERQREGRLVSEPCWGGWGCALPGSTHPSQVLPIPPRGLCLWKALRSWLFLLST